MLEQNEKEKTGSAAAQGAHAATADTGPAKDRVKAGIVGAGYFGMIHGRKYVSQPDAAWVGVFDASREAADAAVAELGGTVFRTPEDLFAAVDVVSITTPATSHAELAAKALEAGCHVMVEKPLALTTDEANALVKLANEKGLILQVGHQERFVFAHYGLLRDKHKPTRIECRRAGPFTGRGMDVSVVMDLMIHDLDLVNCMAAAPDSTPGIADLKATGRAVHGATVDDAEAEIVFADGLVAKLSASRIADARERWVTLTYPDGIIEIDFVNRTFRNTTRHRLAPVFGDEGTTPGADVLTDPVGYSIGTFLRTVQGERPDAVSGAQARRAVFAAEQILAVLDGQMPVLAGGLRRVQS